MLVMVGETINMDEELANMKAILERLSKESKEKDAQIKRQNKQIADLKKKFGKRSSEVSNKGSRSEDSDKESNHNKESDDERKPKSDSSLNSMLVEQIQNLIGNAVKAHLGGDSHKTHLYKKHYTKRIDAFCIPHDYHLPTFQQFDGKGNPKYTSLTLSKLEIMLALKEIDW